MKKSKLILLFKTLIPQAASFNTTQKKLKAFDKWLCYKIENRLSQEVYDLFCLIRPFAPKFDAPNLKQDRLFQQLFPEQKVSASYFRKVSSALSKSIEDFLVQEAIKKNKEARRQVLKTVYFQRGNQEGYRQLLQQQIEQLERKTCREAKDYSSLAELKKELYEEPSGIFRHKPELNLIQEYEENLDYAYLLKKLILLNEKAEIKQVLNPKSIDINKGSKSLEKSWLQLQIDTLPSHPLVFKLYLARLNQDADFFGEAKKAVLDMNSTLGLEDRKRLFIWLINDTNKKLRQTAKEQPILKELLQFYQFGMDNELLVESNRLSHRTYFNIVGLTSVTKEYEYGLFFINKYTALLEPQYKNAAYNWAMAHHYYHSNQIEECLLLIRKAYKKYHIFSMQIRVLEIKALYTKIVNEEKTFELLEYRLANAMKWISNDGKSSSDQKEVFQNFVKMVRRIYHKQGLLQVSKEEKNKLLRQLKNIRLISSRAWLINQIESL